MSTVGGDKHLATPEPREARRHEWPWGNEVVGVCDNGDSWTAEKVVAKMNWPTMLGTISPQRGRSIFLQLDGNRFAILGETDRDQPNGIWFAPMSLVKESLVRAIQREDATYHDRRPSKWVEITKVDGKSRARRGYRWASRGNRDSTIRWLDAEPLIWEVYCQSVWPKHPPQEEVFK